MSDDLEGKIKGLRRKGEEKYRLREDSAMCSYFIGREKPCTPGRKSRHRQRPSCSKTGQLSLDEPFLLGSKPTLLGIEASSVWTVRCWYGGSPDAGPVDVPGARDLDQAGCRYKDTGEKPASRTGSLWRLARPTGRDVVGCFQNNITSLSIPPRASSVTASPFAPTMELACLLAPLNMKGRATRRYAGTKCPHITA